MDQIGSDPSRRGKLVKTSAVKNEQSKAGQRPSETVDSVDSVDSSLCVCENSVSPDLL